MTAHDDTITDPAFWRRPLQERMDHFAGLRERSPFVEAEVYGVLSGARERFFASTRYADVVEISRRPADFCSGRGSTSVQDMPEQAMEYFGSFIAMDDPRHARQRGIVARSFTPRQLQKVLDSVETTCAEVVDDLCERGEVDLVAAFSERFPLLVICDMMGIPRSEFGTVLAATNVILGAGDPEMLGGRDIPSAMLESGMALTALMNDLTERRRREPADDLTTALAHAELGEDMLTTAEIASFFILLAVAGNDTTRTAITAGMLLLADNPGERARWQADLAGIGPTAVEEIVRMAAPVTFMRRTVTRPLTLSGHEFAAGDKVVLFYGAASRDPAEFPDPDRFDVTRTPNAHLGFGGPGPHFCLGAHLARRELTVAFRQLLTRLPDIEVAGDPVPLQSVGIPLVSGIKRLPVRFTPVARAAAG
ncbi:MAG TPA: cytochrome P450 [Acidimicrobiales bacterium]|nr:cytochrome P450 [Acidimicrobiales bacterium]